MQPRSDAKRTNPDLRCHQPHQISGEPFLERSAVKRLSRRIQRHDPAGMVYVPPARAAAGDDRRTEHVLQGAALSSRINAGRCAAPRCSAGGGGKRIPLRCRLACGNTAAGRVEDGRSAPGSRPVEGRQDTGRTWRQHRTSRCRVGRAPRRNHALPDTRITTVPAVGGIGQTRPQRTAHGEHRSASQLDDPPPALSPVAALPGPTHGAPSVADIVREVGSPPDRARATGRLNLTRVARIARVTGSKLRETGDREILQSRDVTPEYPPYCCAQWTVVGSDHHRSRPPGMRDGSRSPRTLHDR
jgi:hypothetical protein